MPPWSIGIVFALVCACPAFADTGPSQPKPSPVSWILSDPLQPPPLFAVGHGELSSPPRGAWLSSDGKSIAFLTRQSSAAEGNARALVVKDVDTDTITFEQVLYSEEEGLERSGPELERLARARLWEARPQLEGRGWQPLPYRENPHHDSEFFSDACFIKQRRPKRSVSLEELKVSYQEPSVQVWRRGKKVLDRRFASWRVRQQTCERASPSWLNGLFAAREQGVVLLELGFCGVDECNEPPAAFHVLRLPGGKPRPGSSTTGQAVASPKGPFVGYEQQDNVTASLYAAGFPAISEDGTLVALAEVSPDGERKDPNLLITVRRSHSQEPAWRLPVLEAGEVSPVLRSLPLSQALDQKVLGRIQQVNDSLTRTRWVPLLEQPIQPVVTGSCQQAPAQKVRTPELELEFSQGRLVLKQAGNTTTHVLTDPRGATPGANGCKVANRTFMDAAYVDNLRGVLLLRLTTCGDEACPVTERWYHTLELP